MASEKAARLFDFDRLWEDDIIKSLKGYWRVSERVEGNASSVT